MPTKSGDGNINEGNSKIKHTKYQKVMITVKVTRILNILNSILK